MAKLSVDSVICRGSAHVETALDGQTVMMSLARGKYYALEGTGQCIWELIREPIRVGTLIEALTARYEVDPARCEADLLDFLDTLAEHDLIAEAGAGPAQ